jgi:hypothetical protein
MNIDEIENLFLVTSIINIPNLPFSYTNTRSVYNVNERFEQTKITLDSIKKLVPNVKILFIECSDITNEIENYLINNSDYFINLYNNEDIRKKVFGISKALGEGELTLNAINFIQKNNIKFKNFFKISGRYYLSDKFNYSEYNNSYTVVQKINNDIHNISTFLYKLDYNYIFIFKNFLINNYNKMINCIGYEVLFSEFVLDLNNIKYIDILGVKGYIAVSGDIIDR